MNVLFELLSTKQEENKRSSTAERYYLEMLLPEEKYYLY